MCQQSPDRTERPPLEIATIGLVLTKNVFQVHGVNERGKAVLRKQLKRDQVAPFFANLPPCLIGTEHNCGVLIYVFFADRAVEIVADRGIHACCGDQAWREVCAEMQSQFTEERFAEGSLAGVRAVGELVARHFPRPVPQTDELPDRPLLP